MSITTLDQLIAGMRPAVDFYKSITPTLVASRPHSLFYLGGLPGAATASSAGLSGEALTSYAGQLPYGNPASGSSYLARFQGQATIAGTLLLCDRLWQNSGITITSTGSQTITSATFPARDNNGSTNGEGVLVGVEVSAATGAGTPTLTLGYTNSDGTNSRTATNLYATVASSAIGAFYPIGLQAGDKGVRSIETYQQSATWTSGTIHLVAYRVLSRLDLGATPVNAIDALVGGMPRAYDNTVPFLIFIPSTTTASYISGHVIWSHG